MCIFSFHHLSNFVCPHNAIYIICITMSNLTGTKYLVFFCQLLSAYGEGLDIYILHCLLPNLFKAYTTPRNIVLCVIVYVLNVETSQRPMVSRSYQHSVDTALDTNFTHRRKSFTFVSFLMTMFLVHKNIYSYIFILSFL